MAERDPTAFCKIVAGELPATIVAEDDRTVSFMDINPATRGPRARGPARARHRPARRRRGGPVGLRGAAAAGRRAKDALGADGVNLLNSCGAAAWQTVFHFTST
jgi:histidine triad (HIT) family protein